MPEQRQRPKEARNAQGFELTTHACLLNEYNMGMRSTHVSGDDYPHRGLTMHEMPVGANVPGLVFLVGSALVFLFAIPALWYVIAASVVVGLLVSALLQLFYRSHPDEAERLTFRL